MTRGEAEALVDKWVGEWRVYLDGGLHRKAREALVAALADHGAPVELKRRRRMDRPDSSAAGMGGE